MKMVADRSIAMRWPLIFKGAGLGFQRVASR